MSDSDHKRPIDPARGDAVPVRAPPHLKESDKDASNDGAQPRQRPLIINRPDMQTVAQRYGYMSFTFIAWMLWLYLVVPIFSVLAWAAGLSIIYEAMLQELMTQDLFDMLWLYGSGIGVFTGIYLIWAITSYMRWHNVERRRPAVPVNDSNLANSHHLTQEQLQGLRYAKRLVISAEMLEQMFDPPTEPIEAVDAGEVGVES